MNALLYRLLLWLAFPLIVYQAAKRCRKADRTRDDQTPKIPHCLAARFGLNPTKFKQDGIWIHAVSVGETRSIFPLLKALKQSYPDLPITLTSGSTQGAIQALKFAPVEIQHQMIPYDYPFAVKRFLNQIKPKLVIMVETEIWPNLYQACADKNIPLILANARLKDKSFEAYSKFGGTLVKNALNQTHLIAAQFKQDKANFAALGAKEDKIKILGNLKFDIEVARDLEEKAKYWRWENQAEQRFIWVAASTHKHEEELMLQAHQALLKHQPNALLILVPRHTDRFTEVAELLEPSSASIRSKNENVTNAKQVYLADTIGELMLWFQIADVAFIGGSLVDFGGHNILEPAALNKPVLSGQYHQNLQALYDSFKEDAAVIISKDADELAQQLIELANHPEKRQAAAEKAFKCFRKQSGALKHLMAEIHTLLK
ncbi:lipid IV(A) 3-deoxy-D-manno-octulosonic acid transferase [Hydrogenovibrio kuenenii]|uniref:lipid IV(A) 3-deoxy-D-manno-octulosonic acid transferase n=1 Tax=Hydrogenovibrio kuenenii TaxID=63658 RepID=UPI0004663A87|nr:lipid IV(A) 3-deoxy-D-manno-octulosonic acid transferase [Hydrogenovibrio kuenenii]